MTDNVTVSNLPPYQQYTVRSTGTSSGQLQHVRLDIGSGTSESQVSGSSPLPVSVYSGLVPESYDYISLSYTDGNLTGVVYKDGGSAGTTVATLTLGYTDGNLVSVTRT